jgi:hypothetical protein
MRWEKLGSFTHASVWTPTSLTSDDFNMRLTEPWDPWEIFLCFVWCCFCEEMLLLIERFLFLGGSISHSIPFSTHASHGDVGVGLYLLCLAHYWYQSQFERKYTLIFRLTHLLHACLVSESSCSPTSSPSVRSFKPDAVSGGTVGIWLNVSLPVFLFFSDIW